MIFRAKIRMKAYLNISHTLQKIFYKNIIIVDLFIAAF